MALWICSFSHRSISEIRHWCWVRRPGVQSTFHFISKVFSGIEVRILCRWLEIIHSSLGKPYHGLHGLALCLETMFYARTCLGALIPVRGNCNIKKDIFKICYKFGYDGQMFENIWSYCIVPVVYFTGTETPKLRNLKTKALLSNMDPVFLMTLTVKANLLC